MAFICWLEMVPETSGLSISLRRSSTGPEVRHAALSKASEPKKREAVNFIGSEIAVFLN